MIEDTFASHLREASPAQRVAVARAVADAVARARAAHGGIELDDDAFVRFLAAKIDARADAVAAIAALRVESLWLARAAAAGDTQAVAGVEVMIADLERTLARFRRDTAFVDEVRQRVRERLLVGDAPKILDYGGRGDLGRWVRAVALRIAIDLVRALERQPSDEDALVRRAVPDDDPELAHMKQHYGAVFRAAIRQSLAELDTRGRNALRLYYLDGLTLEELARLQQVVASTVWRRLAQARAHVLERTRARLREELAIGETDLDSVLRLVESRFELPLSAFDADPS